MNPSIKKFLEMNLKYKNKLSKLCKPFFDYFGATQLCYSHVDFNGHSYVLNTHHELWADYLERKCYLTDPMVRHPSFTKPGYYVWPTMVSADYQKDALDAFQKKFNIGQGITFCLKDNTGYVGFAFGGPRANEAMINKILSDLPMVKRFMYYLEKSLAEVIKDLNNNRVNFGTLKRDGFYEAPQACESIQERIQFLKNIAVFNDRDAWLLDVKLTPRQSLYGWYSLKKVPIKTMAKLLHVCVTTIYKDKAKLHKILRAKTRSELLKRFKKLELIYGTMVGPIGFKQSMTDYKKALPFSEMPRFLELKLEEKGLELIS